MLKIRTTDHPKSAKANSLTPHASVTAAAVLPASPAGFQPGGEPVFHRHRRNEGHRPLPGELAQIVHGLAAPKAAGGGTEHGGDHLPHLGETSRAEQHPAHDDEHQGVDMLHQARQL